MNTAELNEYFQGKIYPQLNDLEARRKNKANLKIKVWLFIIISLILLILYIHNTVGMFDSVIWFYGFTALVYMFGSAYLFAMIGKGLFKEYTPRIVNLALDYACDSHSFKPQDQVSESSVLKSGLFLNLYNTCYGQNHIQCVISDIHIQLSSLFVAFIPTADQGHQYYFNGVFFEINLKQPIDAPVILQPKHRKKWTSKELLEPDVINISDNNVAFENKYKYFSNNEALIYRVFSDDVCNLILNVDEKFNVEVHLSIIDSKLFIGIEHDINDFLELKSYSPINTDKDPMLLVVYIDFVSELFSLIHHKLNNKN